ncbi:acyl-CoA dehydrogenase family protein [Streptomyces sp. MST-110588]|uniref:acyl-CoA dehydrogenase family protein n=1 Tax=Streptomyces sp. MST-110588 TaxID=2833628 RepID=UPI001F5D2D0A|nr:acyl-CoA dehydrogenase family protein [Streptomyces sp. MST-110588]UNO38534.1 acyl-CoA/acyl-ACP dehydrogenase [Streptomyces sp. MST-110588]
MTRSPGGPAAPADAARADASPVSTASANTGPDLVRTAAELAAALRDRAADWDQRQELPPEVRRTVAEAGLLGVAVPPEYGGSGLGAAELGEVCAHLGGVCSALRGLVTVQSMVAAALLRWGTEAQRARWLPPLARGTRIAAFAATEPDAGSALAHVRTRVENVEEEAAGKNDKDRAEAIAVGSGQVVVTGHKRWITFGRSADVFLVLGRSAAGPVTVLVEADRPGVRREPVSGQLGMRAADIAHVRFDAVTVPRENLVAPAGAGLTHVAATALDHGRFTVAWGCVGMAEACVADAAEHAVRRTQGDVALAGHQLVGALLARAAVETAAARELCARAARLRTGRGLRAVTETIVAKYAAAQAAGSAAHSAVQVLGSAGCGPESRAGRFFRDAKIMEIIEGSQQVAELHIADRLFRQHGLGGTSHADVTSRTEASA